MQRVRIGLTGLACVFLLVVLAASLFGLVGGDFSEPENQFAAANTTAEEPREPLAELGVTPGGMPDAGANVVINQAAPAQPAN